MLLEPRATHASLAVAASRNKQRQPLDISLPPPSPPTAPPTAPPPSDATLKADLLHRWQFLVPAQPPAYQLVHLASQ